MAQSSAPLVGQQFTDEAWRDLFGDEPGVIGDMDGTSYRYVLPSSGDVMTIGSSSQPSLARVAGFAHRIPAGQPEGITIPPASGSARTDVTALRYDPAYTGAPGPVRLVLISNTSATAPSYDASPPGAEHLPLWAVTRQPGQTLAQATVRRLFSRIAPTLEVGVNGHLPLNAPVGTIVYQGAVSYVREISGQGVPVWTLRNSGSSGTLSLAGGWVAHGAGADTPRWHLSADGRVTLQGTVRRTATSFAVGNSTEWTFATLPDNLRPPAIVKPLAHIGVPGSKQIVRLVARNTDSTLRFQGFTTDTGSMEANTGYIHIDGASWLV